MAELTSHWLVTAVPQFDSTYHPEPFGFEIRDVTRVTVCPVCTALVVDETRHVQTAHAGSLHAEVIAPGEIWAADS